MTGGQMAPTTIMGQVTKTTPFGRDRETNGYPIGSAKCWCPLREPSYLARVAVHTPKAIIQAKKFIKRAFEVQLAGLGFSLVEVLSACPTNWGLSPLEAVKWLEENMVPYYPLGEYKSPAGGAIND